MLQIDNTVFQGTIEDTTTTLLFEEPATPSENSNITNNNNIQLPSTTEIAKITYACKSTKRIKFSKVVLRPKDSANKEKLLLMESNPKK